VGAWVLGGQGREGKLLLGVLGGMLASGGVGGAEEESRARRVSS
jgi:hypothetical protein